VNLISTVKLAAAIAVGKSCEKYVLKRSWRPHLTLTAMVGAGAGADAEVNTVLYPQDVVLERPWLQEEILFAAKGEK
jgi:hypothetical protein